MIHMPHHVAALLIEMLVVRPLGYRTETIGDINEFTSADALPVNGRATRFSFSSRK